MAYREMKPEKVEPARPVLGIKDMTFDQLMMAQPTYTRERA
jgi:hypothetical protein